MNHFEQELVRNVRTMSDEAIAELVLNSLKSEPARVEGHQKGKTSSSATNWQDVPREKASSYWPPYVDQVHLVTVGEAHYAQIIIMGQSFLGRRTRGGYTIQDRKTTEQKKAPKIRVVSNSLRSAIKNLETLLTCRR